MKFCLVLPAKSPGFCLHKMGHIKFLCLIALSEAYSATALTSSVSSLWRGVSHLPDVGKAERSAEKKFVQMWTPSVLSLQAFL